MTVRLDSSSARIVLLVALILLAARDASAQTGTAADSVQPRRDTSVRRAPICFRGRPLPRCRAFWITEVEVMATVRSSTFNYSATVGGAPRQFSHDAVSDHVAWEIGGMWNRDSIHAVGAALHVEFGDNALVGVDLRSRRWLSKYSSAEFAGGVVGGHVERWTPQGIVWPTAAGLTARMTLDLADLVAGFGEQDLLYAAGRPLTVTYLGARVGSQPAVIGTAIFGALLAWWVHSLAHNDF